MKIASSFRNGIQQKPYDSRVEWLSNNSINGNLFPYIDMDFDGTNNMDVDVLLQLNAPAGDYKFWGKISLNAPPTTSARYLSLATYQNVYRNTTIPTTNKWTRVQQTLRPDSALMTITAEGEEAYTASSWWSVNRESSDKISTCRMPLFGQYNSWQGLANFIYSGRCKIQYAKFSIDEQLVRDFIPVRVGNVGYMYDRVSKKLFGNVSQSGVEFEFGNDII